MGLLYLRNFKPKKANSRILDVSNPIITLLAVENTLSDLIPDNREPMFVVSIREKNNVVRSHVFDFNRKFIEIDMSSPSPC